MNFKKNKFLLALSFGAMLFSGCDKNEIKPFQEIVVDKAKILIVNAIPTSPTPPVAPSTLNVFVNNAKLNGNTISFAGRFPGVGYSILNQGTYNFRTEAFTTDVTVAPSTVPVTQIIQTGTILSTNSVSVEVNKFYTLFVVGKPRDVTSAFLVEDKINTFAEGKAYVRFVNTMPDGGALDLFAGVIPTGSSVPLTSSVLIPNVPTSTAKDFVAIDATSTGTLYQLQLKNNLTGANVGLTLNLSAATGKYYTMISRGFNTAYTVPNITPARVVAAAPGLTLILNN